MTIWCHSIYKTKQSQPLSVLMRRNWQWTEPVLLKANWLSAHRRPALASLLASREWITLLMKIIPCKTFLEVDWQNINMDYLIAKTRVKAGTVGTNSWRPHSSLRCLWAALGSRDWPQWAAATDGRSRKLTGHAQWETRRKSTVQTKVRGRCVLTLVLGNAQLLSVECNLKEFLNNVSKLIQIKPTKEVKVPQARP